MKVEPKQQKPGSVIKNQSSRYHHCGYKKMPLLVSFSANNILIFFVPAHFLRHLKRNRNHKIILEAWTVFFWCAERSWFPKFESSSCKNVTATFFLLQFSVSSF